MALTDEVTSRLPDARLKNLTNGKVSAATEVNTARLALAATDVEADFKTYAGIIYDNNEAQHVSEAVIGVEMKLQSWNGDSKAAADRLTAWQKNLTDNLRLVTAQDRVEPKSTSDLTPADEKPEGIDEVRPDFDVEEHFQDLTPNAPN